MKDGDAKPPIYGKHPTIAGSPDILHHQFPLVRAASWLTRSVTRSPPWRSLFSCGRRSTWCVSDEKRQAKHCEIVIGKSLKRVFVLLCATSTLIACGHGGEEEGPQKSNNIAPTISGIPETCVVEGENYEFIPHAGDTDGGILAFSVNGRPFWAQFQASTGKLSGIPGPGDVGSYADITIAVNDGETTRSLPLFSIDVLPLGSGQATLSWIPPTTNQDGTALIDLAGYRIYYGTEENNYKNDLYVGNMGIADYVVDDLCPNTYFFAVAAVNTAGLESDYSNTTSKTIF